MLTYRNVSGQHIVSVASNPIDVANVSELERLGSKDSLFTSVDGFRIRRNFDEAQPLLALVDANLFDQPPGAIAVLAVIRLRSTLALQSDSESPMRLPRFPFATALVERVHSANG